LGNIKSSLFFHQIKQTVMTLIPQKKTEGARALTPPPLTEPPLSGSLLELATKVWAQRMTILSDSDVYNIYAEKVMEPDSTPIRTLALTQFFRSLLLLGEELNIESRMQDYPSAPLRYFVGARENYVRLGSPISNRLVKSSVEAIANRFGVTPEDYLVWYMAHSFYFFYSKVQCKLRHRVYLHAKTRYREDLKSALHLFDYVCREIVTKIKGASSAKISANVRIDSILIYTSSMDVSNLVIAKIQKYQKINGLSGFEPEIPPMTQLKMYGVSTGDEPPLFAMQEGKMLPIRKANSFGGFRAQLIYNALKDSTDRDSFFKLIVEYFRVAGIDANQPSVQLACPVDQQKRPKPRKFRFNCFSGHH